MVVALGSRVAAPTEYSPDVLEPIARNVSTAAGDDGSSGRYGYDRWHLYELSWLDSSGHAQSYVGVLCIDVKSAATIESKSLKLYLNSLNFKNFSNPEEAKSVICSDVGNLAGSEVTLQLFAPEDIGMMTCEPDGVLLDTLPPCDPSPVGWVSADAPLVRETLLSHRMRSLCPVTAQPDWGTLVVSYSGRRINRQALLDLVDSFRQQQDFHEHCVEQCFDSIRSAADPDALTVTGYYQRRGGIDITPVRASEPIATEIWRMGRQ